MSIADIILITALAATLIFFVAELFRLLRKPSGKTSRSFKIPSKEKSVENIDIKIRQEKDGLHLIIENAVPEDSSPEDFFPDIINDVAPDDRGLDNSFWEKIASLPDMEDPSERERLVRILADNGIISEADIPTLVMLGSEDSPEDDDTDRNEALESKNETQPGTPKPEVEDPEPITGNEDQLVGERIPPSLITEPSNEPAPAVIPVPSPDGDDDSSDFANHVFQI